MTTNFFLTTLGCPKNQVDSDYLLKSFVAEGFVPVNHAGDADIILVNTCGFIEDAKKESIEEILRLVKLKKHQSIKGSKGQSGKKSKKLVVFGCLAKRYKDKLIKEIPEIDAIFGVGENDKIIEHCKSLPIHQFTNSPIHPSTPLPVRQFTHSPTHPFTPYAYLKIAEGCSRKCTYCVIPSIRGEYESAAPDEILKNAERHINSGVKELILIAQDTASYGREFKGYGIANLLKDLCSIGGDFWIRLLYAYPASITDALLKVIACEDKICKYIDLPLQHSEDRILRLMKRGGSRKGYLNLIKKIRSAVPDIALRTTFIVGFPSETEDEFNSMMDFIEETQFDRLGAFKYSKEEGTPASKLKGHLPAAVKNKRIAKIMRHQEHISFEKNKKLAGRRFKAIIDEINHGVAIGRLYSHAPEIDGVVITPEPSSVKVGDFATVEITDVFEYDLKGKIIK